MTTHIRDAGGGGGRRHPDRFPLPPQYPWLPSNHMPSAPISSDAALPLNHTSGPPTAPPPPPSLPAENNFYPSSYSNWDSSYVYPPRYDCSTTMNQYTGAFKNVQHSQTGGYANYWPICSSSSEWLPKEYKFPQSQSNESRSSFVSQFPYTDANYFGCAFSPSPSDQYALSAQCSSYTMRYPSDASFPFTSIDDNRNRASYEHGMAEENVPNSGSSNRRALNVHGNEQINQNESGFGSLDIQRTNHLVPEFYPYENHNGLGSALKNTPSLFMAAVKEISLESFEGINSALDSSFCKKPLSSCQSSGAPKKDHSLDNAAEFLHGSILKCELSVQDKSRCEGKLLEHGSANSSASNHFQADASVTSGIDALKDHAIDVGFQNLISKNKATLTPNSSCQSSSVLEKDYSPDNAAEFLVGSTLKCQMSVKDKSRCDGEPVEHVSASNSTSSYVPVTSGTYALTDHVADVRFPISKNETTLTPVSSCIRDKLCANHFEVASKIGCALSNDNYGEDVDYTESSKDDSISSVDGLVNSNQTVNCGRTVKEEILSNGKPVRGTVTANVHPSLKSASNVESSAASTTKLHSSAYEKFKSMESIRKDEEFVADCLDGSQNTDVAALIKTMHNTSQVLLSSGYNFCELQDAEQMILLSILENLEVYTSKSQKVEKRLDVNVHDPEKRHNVEYATVDSTHGKVNISDSVPAATANLGAEVKRSIEQATRELIGAKEKDSQAALFRNLWIEAEATVCSMKYDLQLARMKHESRECHNNEICNGSPKVCKGISQSRTTSLFCEKGCGDSADGQLQGKAEDLCSAKIMCRPDSDVPRACLQKGKVMVDDVQWRKQIKDCKETFGDPSDMEIMERYRILMSRKGSASSSGEDNTGCDSAVMTQKDGEYDAVLQRFNCIIQRRNHGKSNAGNSSYEYPQHHLHRGTAAYTGDDLFPYAASDKNRQAHPNEGNARLIRSAVADPALPDKSGYFISPFYFGVLREGSEDSSKYGIAESNMNPAHFISGLEATGSFSSSDHRSSDWEHVMEDEA